MSKLKFIMTRKVLIATRGNLECDGEEIRYYCPFWAWYILIPLIAVIGFTLTFAIFALLGGIA